MEPYDAERHLLLGLPNLSPPILARLHYAWYTADSPHTAALYASRSTLPYLQLGSLSAATLSLQTFTSQLSTPPSPPVQTIESSKSTIRIFPSLPLLNFISLLVLACSKGDTALFRQLTRHYAPHLKDMDDQWTEMLAHIGEIWFGIRLPRQGNPLMDMMSGMLFGGGGGNAGGAAGSGRGTPKPAQQKQVGPSAPVPMDLD